MKFLQWLEKKDAEKIPEREVVDKKKKKSKKKSVLAEKMFEVENGVIDITAIEVEEPVEEKFIHEATGKEYKTSAVLKAGITRYNKKMKKLDEEEKNKKFIDTETGKEYKTAAALKAGITRRLKKQKKSEKNE